MGKALAIILALCGQARADEPPPSTQLFDEGRALDADGKTDEACDRYTKSYELEAAPGTLLHLADCAERDGDLPRAWRIFDRAAHEAPTEARRQFAEKRRDKLATHLVTVTLAIAEPDNSMITIGDHEIAARYEIRDAATPGTIVVTAKAPGRPAFRRTLHAEAGESIVLEIKQARPVARSHAWRNALIASGSAAVVALGAELYFASESQDAALQIRPMNIDHTVTSADCDHGLPAGTIYNDLAFSRACRYSRYETYAAVTFYVAAAATVVSLVGLAATWSSGEHPAIAITPAHGGGEASVTWSW